MDINIHPSKYLYNTDMKEFKRDSYEDVLFTKILLGKHLVRTLVIEDNMSDTQRLNKVMEAIEFNKKLLLELGYDEVGIASKLKEYKYNE